MNENIILEINYAHKDFQIPTIHNIAYLKSSRYRLCRYRMVVGFTTTCAINAHHH